MQLVEARSI